MKKTLISIITAVYKAEAYLDRLINSVINQTYPHFELILVDDGSPDRSGEICDEYASKDSRIRVFHKENGGVGSARQAGLEKAIGEYVIHADSDDWVAPNMLEELVQCVDATHADMIVFDFYRVNKYTKVFIRQEPTSLHYIQVLRDVVSGHIYACSWNKLIKRDAIIKYNASFPKDCNFSEDKRFLVSLLNNPLSVAYVPKALYYYDVTVNTERLVRQITANSMKNGFAMVDYLEKQLGIEFQDEIAETKRRLKLRAIESKLYTNAEVNDIYKELNVRLVKDVVLFRRHHIDDYVLCLATLKLVWVAHALKRLFLLLYKIKQKIISTKANDTKNQCSS